ncbi:MAG TPA: hypothetical protein VK465_18730 [Fibrobacteria bacterium]|nr:hypothetical protein [Fibrobacteria bacterium]
MGTELLPSLYTGKLELLRIRARARAWRRVGRIAAEARRGSRPRPRFDSRLRDHDVANLLPEVLRAEAFRNALALGL